MRNLFLTYGSIIIGFLALALSLTAVFASKRLPAYTSFLVCILALVSIHNSLQDIHSLQEHSMKLMVASFLIVTIAALFNLIAILKQRNA